MRQITGCITSTETSSHFDALRMGGAVDYRNFSSHGNHSPRNTHVLDGNCLIICGGKTYDSKYTDDHFLARGEI